MVSEEFFLPDYQVEIPVTGRLSVRVKADSEESALEAAADIVDACSLKTEYSADGVTLMWGWQTSVATQEPDGDGFVEDAPELWEQRAVRLR